VWFSVSQKLTFVFSLTCFSPVRFVAKRWPTAKVYEGTNRNLSARNTLVQLLALYTDPESHSAQRYRQTDRRTDDRMLPTADDRLKVGRRSYEGFKPFEEVGNNMTCAGTFCYISPTILLFVCPSVRYDFHFVIDDRQ